MPDTPRSENHSITVSPDALREPRNRLSLTLGTVAIGLSLAAHPNVANRLSLSHIRSIS